MSDDSRALPPDAPKLLHGIDSPEDLRRLPLEKLGELCGEMRAFLMESVGTTGGHLGSNLGVVELTTALHYVYDFRRDRLIWDVSHQAYPHKILTGRRKRFEKLRSTGGMCGFTNPAESEYDLFHTGHAGTSISLGLGLVAGTMHEPEPRHVVTVIGDASLGAGVAFEALNNAGALGRRMLVILNDNEWSISKSVGAMARYLSRIRSNRLMQRAGQETKNLLHAIPVIGPRVDRALEQLGEVMRHAVVPGHVFEELGVTYVGPIDGHDVKLLVETLKRVSRLDGVVLLHILTEKGKGHPKAPDHPERVHAVKGETKLPPASPRVELPPQAAPKAVSWTRAFALALIRAAERDLRIQAITAAMPSGTGLDAFEERFPARFYDTGITEQHAVAMSAGMAKGGLRPVAAIYSTFLQRAYDQVFQEVALQNLPVLFCMDRAGLVGQDGPTHNGVFDIAYLRTLPNFTLCAPRDATDLSRMLEMALSMNSPVALRYPRGECPIEETIHASERRRMEPGTAEVLAEGDRLVIWAYGALVSVALETAERLRARGVAIGVVDARFAKPLDEEMLARDLARYRTILTLEEHQRAGGFGSAVLEAASRLPVAASGEGLARVKVLAVPDRFIEHKSTREEQLHEVGLDADGVERTIRTLLSPSLV